MWRWDRCGAHMFCIVQGRGTNELQLNMNGGGEGDESGSTVWDHQNEKKSPLKEQQRKAGVKCADDQQPGGGGGEGEGRKVLPSDQTKLYYFTEMIEAVDRLRFLAWRASNHLRSMKHGGDSFRMWEGFTEEDIRQK